jgi:hypothetical protein
LPNTLAHLGIHGLTTRALNTKADLKWVYLGAVIPDFPWILQRAASYLFTDINLYNLRLYVIIQSTLLFSIILSAGLAFLSKNYLKTFLILSFGSLIHLVLDAMQIKWANGVHLLAPLSWEMLNFNLFWPESIPTYLITALGLVYFIFLFKEFREAESDLIIKSFTRWFYLFIVTATYSLLPLLILHQPLEADNHYVKTLSEVESREGKYFEIDRRSVRFQDEGGIMNTFANEDIKLKGVLHLWDKDPITLSIKAKFIDKNTAEVVEYYKHIPEFRDNASYMGLVLVLVFWIVSVFKRRKEIF